MSKKHTAYMIFDPRGRYVETQRFKWAAIEEAFMCETPEFRKAHNFVNTNPRSTECGLRQRGWKIVKCALIPEE